MKQLTHLECELQFALPVTQAEACTPLFGKNKNSISIKGFINFNMYGITLNFTLQTLHLLPAANL